MDTAGYSFLDISLPFSLDSRVGMDELAAECLRHALAFDSPLLNNPAWKPPLRAAGFERGKVELVEFDALLFEEEAVALIVRLGWKPAPPEILLAACLQNWKRYLARHRKSPLNIATVGSYWTGPRNERGKMVLSGDFAWLETYLVGPICPGDSCTAVIRP